jgi:methyl-accepting chemotaxis protein
VSSTLSNISVKLKLMLGFAIVLLLTVLIAVTGWAGLSTLSEQGERLVAIGKLNETLRDVRIARLSYTINLGADKAAAVTQGLDSMEEQAGQLRKHFSAAENLALVGRLTDALTQYRANFGLFTQSTDAREATRTVFGNHADAAVAELAAMSTAIQQSDTEQATAERQLQGIEDQAKLVQEARFQVRGYTYSGKLPLREPAVAAIDAARANLTALTTLLPPTLAGNVQRLNATLTSYRTAVGAFGDAQLAADKAQQSLNDNVAAMFDASKQLSASQIAARDRDTQSARQLLVAAAIGALILGILAAWLITAQIVGPLLDILKGVERVAQGDLTRDFDNSRRDELGLLQAGMQRMTLSLRELIGGIRDGSVQIASAAEQLSAVTEQTNAGVNNQKVETDQVATAINEMSATVQEVARNAQDASGAAANASREAREGDAVVNRAMAQIVRLATEVGNSTQAMNDLKRESDKIGGVLDVIKAVAQQTNLLALNAAIEAARAGEAGRGFAVVADEVRSLAQRTQQSTEEIEGLISSLQTGTDHVASILEGSRALTDSSVDMTRQASASLAGITQAVASIEAMNQQIATAAEEQSAVTDEINRSVMNVRDISEQTSSASEETAASSVELARLGVHLQGLVGRFKV